MDVEALRRHARRRRQLGAPNGVDDDRLERVSESDRVARRYEHRVGRPELFGDASDGGRHDRQAEGGGLHGGDGKSLPRGRQHEDVARRDDRDGIRTESGQHHLVEQTQLVPAGCDLLLEWPLADGDQAE